MRKTIFTLGLMLAAALSLTSCSKNEEVNFTPELKPSFELFANLDSRTTNDGIHTKWAVGDAINVFHAEAGTTNYVNDTPYVDGAGTPFVTDGTGNFTGALSEELTAEAYDWYTFYPYSSYIKTPANTSSGYTPIGCESDEVQTQSGNDNMSHIAGDNYPLYGVARSAASEKPQITMKHLTSLLAFDVYDQTGEGFVVNSIAFTAPEDIVGTYYINFAAEPVVYTGSGDTYVSSTATLTVEDGEEVTADGAIFYMGIKPFTAKANSTLTVKITTDKGTFEKSITLTKDTTFAAGKFKTITVNVDELVVPDEPEGETIEFVFADEGLSNGTSYTTFTKNDIDVIFGAGTNTSNDPKYYDGGTAMRMYKQNTLTISGAIITNISMTLSQDYDNLGLVEGQSGSLAYNSKVYTWSGNDTSVEFYNKSTASENNQVRIQKIAITYIPADPYAPSMSVDKTSVEVTAEATTEHVNVALKNLEDSDVTVVSSESWVVADLAEGVLTLNIAANTDTSARTATVTISAEGIEKTITINQEGAAKTTTIDMITATGNYSIANAWVVATYAQGCLITDSSNKYILCYMGYNATNIPAVGTVVNVEGAVSEHGGLLQFGADSVITATDEKKTVDHGTAVEMSGADLDAYLTEPVVKYASFEGALAISNSKYYNVTVSGASTAVGSISYPTTEFVTQLTELNGKNIKATGYLIGVSSDKYTNMMITSVEATGTTPEPEPEPEPEQPTEGETVTFKFDQKSGNGNSIITRHEGVITCVVAQGISANAPNEHADGHLRFMGSNTMTISGATITNVVFEFASENYVKQLSANVGDIQRGETSSTWIGSAQEVVFKNEETAQARILSVKVTYTANPDSVEKTEQNLSFTNSSVNVNLDDTYTGQQVNNAETTVSYSSSNTGVATVNSETGAVTLVGPGTTTITATAVETELYYGAEASYILTVKNTPAGEGGTATTGTILWSEDFGAYGSSSTTFNQNKEIAGYDYAGRDGFGDNASAVTLTADASNNVRCTTATGTNCTSGHLWFNKSANGSLTTSAIKLYGATSLSFSHSQGTNSSICTSEYSTDGGNTWISLGQSSGNNPKKEYTFKVSEGIESIQIRLSHPASNAKNTRVDNLELKVK